MRCIEMLFGFVFAYCLERLIETWDVLKCFSHFLGSLNGFGINRNMRCIEIEIFDCSELEDTRLIETWDVLKYIKNGKREDRGIWLIETWDVLK